MINLDDSQEYAEMIGERLDDIQLCKGNLDLREPCWWVPIGGEE